MARVAYVTDETAAPEAKAVFDQAQSGATLPNITNRLNNPFVTDLEEG